MIKSHETNKETEESTDSSQTPQKEEKRRRSPTPPPARNSPEPSCAICLEQLQNKSFTDSCFHMFCFTCLVEWSKVKPECPLCKKSFKSIVHNVRSFSDFDQYYITKSKLSSNIWELASERSFRYNSTLTHSRFHGRSRIENEIASHRMRYAPHSMHSVPLRMFPGLPVRRGPSSFRRRIYQQNLWVKPIASTRIRDVSPAFFRANIACTHRLLPWLNRELLVVMSDNESQISFMIDLIMALIVKYEITSHEFYSLIEPYTTRYTGHFIHEFYNFAISPYETMDVYDMHSVYSTLPFQPVSEDERSQDSDVIPIEGNELSSHMGTSGDSAKRKQRSFKKKLKEECKKLKKIILKRNTQNNCWETIMPPVQFGNYSVSYELSEPSTSRTKSILETSMEVANTMIEEYEAVASAADSVPVDDDECQVVDMLKPRHERTPEIVNLSSDDERTIIVDDIPKVDTIFEDNSDNNLFVSIMETNLNTNFDDDDIVILKEVSGSYNVPDAPIDYSLKSSRSAAECESKNEISEPCSSKDVAGKEEIKEPSRNQFLQSSMQTLTNDDLCSSSSWSPLLRPKKKSLTLDDISTESCSESAQLPEKETKVKKLKLRSVVAHFSFDPSDEHDSTHHSSSVHKKHKERKKKKKKHKHKRRIYSSDSDY